MGLIAPCDPRDRRKNSGCEGITETWLMRLPLDETWVERLRQLRGGYGTADAVEAILGCEAVFLCAGSSGWLGLDGRVVGWASDGSPPTVVDDLKSAAKAIVMGARQLQLAELVTLLPLAPRDVGPCPFCEGHRWDDRPTPFSLDGGPCFGCWGLGWLLTTKT